jgi:Cell wall-associated hydrolases (invasion-associated proteins)
MRKNFIRTFVALLLILSLTGTTAFAESASVTGNAVNLRSGPGTGYGVLDTLPAGTVVEVTDRSNSNWYAVTYRGQSGYMAAGYLQLGGSQRATVVYSEPADASSGEGSAVLILDGASPTAQASASPVVTAAPESAAASQNAAIQSTATPGAANQGSSGTATVTIPAAAPSAQGSAASAATAPAAEEGTAVIILGNNTIVLPAVSVSPASSSAPAAAPAASADTSRVGKSGYINGDFVCFRSAASSTASILSTYNKGKELVISGAASGDWTPCRIDGLNGYVNTRYITLSEEYLAAMAAPKSTAAASSSGTGSSAAARTASGSAAGSTAGSASNSGNAYITGNNVRFRSGPSMSSSILGEFFYGNSVTITGTSGDWTAVSYNGKDGYVYSKYVCPGSYQASAPVVNTIKTVSTGSTGTTTTASSSGSALGQQIANFALQYVGYPYSWGGKSPETGFDCSGFVYYVYSQFGYTLNRVACDQAQNGVHVDPNDLQPGDVLCFYSNDNYYIGHTGIYIGNNKFVHASTSTTGVIITELGGYYFTRGYEARRIV